MYAKALVPGPIPVPNLTATTRTADIVLPQLRARGWADFTTSASDLEPAEARLLITPARLQLVVDEQVILDDDANPVAPPGWWEAVDRHRGRCVVIITDADAVDLTDPHSGSRLRELMDSPGRAVWAIIHIEHSNPADEILSR